jgi:hypothetical protein
MGEFALSFGSGTGNGREFCLKAYQTARAALRGCKGASFWVWAEGNGRQVSSRLMRTR